MQDTGVLGIGHLMSLVFFTMPCWKLEVLHLSAEDCVLCHLQVGAPNRAKRTLHSGDLGTNKLIVSSTTYFRENWGHIDS